VTPGPLRALSRFRLSLLGTALGPLLGLACVVVIFAIADRILGSGTFFTGDNLHTIAIRTCVVAIAALGMTVVIISAGIDLSAGTSLALCATMLAWGLKEDVGFLVRHGGNFSGATQRLDEAQRQLAAARQRGDQPSIDYWQAKRDEHRATLTKLAELKLARAKALLAAVGPRAQAAVEAYESTPAAQRSKSRHDLLQRIADRWLTRSKQLERDVQSLGAKANRLKDADFRPSSDAQWASGIPNDATTPTIAVLLAIATGLAAGLVNGLLISSLRVVPFIVTLGTMTAYLGVGNLLSGNTPIRPVAQDQIPFWMQDMVSKLAVAQWFGLFPSGVFLAIVLAIVLSVLLRRTVFGRHVFAIGSNETAARLCGINVKWTKVAAYGLAGALFGIAGVCHFAVAANGNPNSGVGMELLVIAAVVIGGGSLSGGRGTVLGTLAGAGIMQVIESGCRQIGVAEGTRLIILGAAIIGAVWIDQVRQRRLPHS
jgi:ribose transport system permease protein